MAAHQEIDADAELALAAEHGIDVLIETDEIYPRPLRQIHDPPGVLFRRGTMLEPQDELAIAIVGTRHATRYGLAQAERLAGSLARVGFTIVSGLARGIDAAAHRGAHRGRRANDRGARQRAARISIRRSTSSSPAKSPQSGCLLSEAPPRMMPLSGAFPQRNRIISGLSVGTIVVEAANRSGALITARHAYEQGREVFAVPGPIDSRLSHGCHALIKDGAKLVESIDDVLAELGPLAEHIERDDGTVVAAAGRAAAQRNRAAGAAGDRLDADLDRRGGDHLRPADPPRALDRQRAGNAPAGAAGERHAGRPRLGRPVSAAATVR